ncbi:MAG TPA: TonB-dependent receptor, partial [Steroidobacter sp.]
IARFEPLSLPAGPLAAAVGFETRTQGFDSVLDESLNRNKDSISLTFLNDFSLGLERDVDAYFAEVSVPITSEASNFAGARSLDLTLAGRRESFSDFGDATVKRATLRWQPLESDVLTFRTSYSESFYAPELRDVLLLGDSNANIYVDPLITAANGSPISYTMTTITGGNPNLQPTTGEYLNFGLIFKPGFLDGLRVMLDVWHLDQEKAFVYPTPQGVINGTSPGTVERSSTALPGEPVGRITTVTARTVNAATRTVRGVDFNVSYGFDIGAVGRLNIDSNNTFTTKFTYDQKDGRGPQNALGQVSAYYSMDVVPRFRSDLVLGYGQGAMNVSLQTSYTRGVVHPLDNWAKIDDYVKTDFTATVDLSGFGMFGESSVWLSVQDVFDQGVPYVFGRTAGVTSDYTYADFIGQFVTLGMRTRF